VAPGENRNNQVIQPTSSSPPSISPHGLIIIYFQSKLELYKISVTEWADLPPPPDLVCDEYYAVEESND